MYDELAPYYDLIHASLTDDIEFIKSLAAEQKGAVLELGCGTGRVTIPLARDGILTYGVDSSAEMLKIARKKLSAERVDVQKHVKLILSDIKEYLIDFHFTLAVVPYNTLMHFDHAGVNKLLRKTCSHLEEGCSLFLDLQNPLSLRLDEITDSDPYEESEFQTAGGGSLILKTRSEINSDLQIISIQSVIELFDGDANPSDVKRFTTTYHYYYPHQLEMMLKATGFSITAVYGDYDQVGYGEDSERLLIVAKKG